MISISGFARVVFEEVPITDERPLFVIDTITAMLACGFWYARDGQPWLEDVLIGPKHVQDFKHAPRSSLRRRIIARMDGNALRIEGQLMSAPDVAAQYAADPAFRRRCLALPPFEGIRCKITAGMPKARSVLSEQHNRQIILPMRGDLTIKHLLATEYEDG